MPSGNIYYNHKNLSLGFNISAITEKRKSTQETFIDFGNSNRASDQYSKNNTKELAMGLTLNYAINDKSDIGFAYNTNLMNSKQNGNKIEKFYNRSVVDLVGNTDFYSKDKYKYHSFVSYYDLKLDTIGSKMSLNFSALNKNIDNSKEINTTNYAGDFYNKKRDNLGVNNNKPNYKVYSLGADFYMPYSFAEIEAGAKATFVMNNNSIDFLNYKQGKLRDRRKQE